MTRLLLLLLTLSVLLSGYGNPYIQGYQNSGVCSLVKINEESSSEVSGQIKCNSANAIKTFASDYEKKKTVFKIDPVVIEEEELNSSRKYLDSNTFLSSFICTQPQGYCLFNSIHHNVLSCIRYTNLEPGKRQPLLQVFRI